jgi:hypothetical protein
MITKQIIFKTLVIFSLIFITSGTVFANSNNDKSIFPLKSKFSKNQYSKIERNLSSIDPREIFGLSAFEQKKLNHYGIEVGNNFTSIVENIDVIFEKNSKGPKITVERTSGGLTFLKYIDQENLKIENINKGTIEDNI